MGYSKSYDFTGLQLHTCVNSIHATIGLNLVLRFAAALLKHR